MSEKTPNLEGMRIIVVEDDLVLANALCSDLRELGATVLGPAPTPFYATQLMGRRKLDAAVLDLYLHGESVFAVADLLHEQGVPILFIAEAGETVPARFRDRPLLVKPLGHRNLAAEIVAMTRRPKVEKIAATNMPAILSRQAPMQTFARALARGISSIN